MSEVNTLVQICLKALLHPDIKNNEAIPLFLPPRIREDIYKLFHLKKCQVNSLQNICASRIISEQIRIPAFSIPIHIFNEMRILNTVKNLREKENLLIQKMIVLEVNHYFAIERYTYYIELHGDTTLWDEELVLQISTKAEYYNNLIEKISFLIFDTRDKLDEIIVEEVFELMRLPPEYDGIQFKLVNQYYDIRKDL